MQVQRQRIGSSITSSSSLRLRSRPVAGSLLQQQRTGQLRRTRAIEEKRDTSGADSAQKSPVSFG